MSQSNILMNLIIKHCVFKLKSRHAKRFKFDFHKEKCSKIANIREEKCIYNANIRNKKCITTGHG